MEEFKFDLGVEVKDVVTGFKGIIMGRTQYTTGCNQYGVLNPELTKEGKLREWLWFDENRIEVTSKNKVRLTSTVRGGPVSIDQVARSK